MVDFLANKLNRTQVLRAALFDLLTSQADRHNQVGARKVHVSREGCALLSDRHNQVGAWLGNVCEWEGLCTAVRQAQSGWWPGDGFITRRLLWHSWSLASETRLLHVVVKGRVSVRTGIIQTDVPYLLKGYSTDVAPVCHGMPAQNIYVSEDGSLKLIDNDQAFTSSWGLNSVFIPGTPVRTGCCRAVCDTS